MLLPLWADIPKVLDWWEVAVTAKRPETWVAADVTRVALHERGALTRRLVGAIKFEAITDIAVGMFAIRRGKALK